MPRDLHCRPGQLTEWPYSDITIRAFVKRRTESIESSFLLHQGGYHDLFVCP